MTYQGDNGIDVRSAQKFRLLPGQRLTVCTQNRDHLDLDFEGNDYCGLVIPRSGLAHEYGITILNSPGLIDSTYKGHIYVVLFNTGNKSVSFEIGDRIAQLLVIRPVLYLPGPERGQRGFGSTGVE